MECYPHKFNHSKIILLFIMKPDYFFLIKIIWMSKICNFSEGICVESLKIQWCSVCQNTGAAVRSEPKGQ